MASGVRLSPVVLLVYIPLMIATGAATVGAAAYGWLYVDLREYRQQGDLCSGLVTEATDNRYDAPSSLVIEPDDCAGLDSVSLVISGLGFDPDSPVTVGDEFAFYVIINGDDVRAIQEAALDEPVGLQALGLGVLSIILWVVSLVVQPWKRVISTGT